MRAAIFVIAFALLYGMADAQPDGVSPRPGDTRMLGGITFVAIPSGDFSMGDSVGDGPAIERPVHRVKVDALWMASTEVTFRQWKAFLEDAGSRPGRSSGLDDDHPVVSITWDEAKAYCAWFSRKYSVVLRLPTEAEWEHAARGGLEGQRYPNGKSISPADANFDQRGPVRVGSYRPNGYGLYDVAGNVFEWGADWYDKDYYQHTPLLNPPGPPTDATGAQRRADRGGGWCMGVERVRVSARHAGPGAWDEGGNADCLGFRPVMEDAGARRKSG